ncbi:hypothetical protein GCM10007862_10450 [Dyella lipolytica]|nr:hypothetical protein GCM10007862_10450 [Dyella lipolytica]
MSSPVAWAYDGDFLGACVSGGVGCNHNKYAKMRSVSVGPLFDDAAQAKIVSEQGKMADKLDECMFDAFIQSFNVEENKLKKHYIASALRCGRLAGYQSGIK